ncbi:MAG: alanine--tRNA ligase, partial [Bdellovibrionales bacterium]|nr:alanine--tRNA ligase [Bdellovibrionales bacterium]
ASGEDRIIEIWNLVFMQFFEKAPGSMDPLPKPSVDTGSGLERVVAVVQGKLNNFDTDIFAPMIETACKIGGFDYVSDLKTLEKHKDIQEKTAALRVLADHCRATGFLIAVGVLPANEGRGYVLRRIMRRAIRYGRKLSESSLLYPMVQSLITNMSDVYPELKQRQDSIIQTVKDEESRFLQTLDTGSEILATEIKNLKQQGQKTLTGEMLFKLYDTYGFPVDLSRLIAEEQGLQADESEFEKYLEEAKQKAKASWKGKTIDSDQSHLIKMVSDYLLKNSATEFTGYSSLSQDATVMLLSDGHQIVDHLSEGKIGYIILDKTSFYAEGGGQTGDRGLVSSSGLTAHVTNTTKISDVYLHAVEITSGELKSGVKVKCQVDRKIRSQTASNHSATHLLHAALRSVLGNHVTQAGSLVDESKLRFDFTYNKPVSDEEIQKIELLVNDEISKNTPVGTHLMSYPKALEFGAMALFGEKYGDQVRVLKMGDFSCELCGGTHVTNTSEIRVFKIVSESGVSSGVRRIEALSGDLAVSYLFKNLQENQKAKAEAQIHEGWENYLARTNVELPLWIDSKKNEIKQLEREIKKMKLDQVDLDQVMNSKFLSNGSIPFVVTQVGTNDRTALSEISDRIKNKIQNGVVVLLGEDEDSTPLIVSVTKDFTSKVKAGDIVKSLCQKLGGKGGGRPDFAQGSLGQLKDITPVTEQIKSNY